MSNIPVTFFRDRAARGVSYRFDVNSQVHVYHFHVYSRRSLDARKLKSREAKGKGEADGVIADVRSMLADKGGVLAVVVEEKEPQGARQLRVVAVPAKGEEPPQHVGVLRPGYPLVLRAASETTIQLHPGSHVLVPVDAEAERQLGELRGHLAYLPADLEALVLNAIRRPSLDARLEKLEAKVFPREQARMAVDRRRSWSGWGPALRNAFMHPAFWPVLLLSILLVGIYLIFRYLTPPGEEPTTEATPTPTLEASSGEPVVTPATTGTLTSAIVTSADPWIRLFTAVSKKRDKPVLGDVYNWHFAAKGGALLDAGILQSLATDENNRRFLWGILKLEALRLDKPAASQPAYLQETDPRTATKDLLRAVQANAPSLLEEGDSRDLRAFLVCRMAFGTSPVIPATGQGGANPALPVAEGNCASYDLAKAAPGVERLTAFVEGWQ